MLKNRHVLLVLWVLVLALAMPGAVLAQDDPNDDKDKKKEDDKKPAVVVKTPPKSQQSLALPSTNMGALFFGGMFNDNDGNLYRVGKYRPLEQGGVPRLGAVLSGNSTTGVFYDFEGQYSGDSRDQNYQLTTDFKRLVQAEVGYKKFPVRLDNDPLVYTDAAIGNFVVRTDHFDPDAELATTLANFGARAAVTMPGAEALSISAGYHRNVRDGHDYAITSSKCSNCHLEAAARPVEQVTNDYDIGVNLELVQWSLEYVYKHRNFEERAATPTNVYDDPLHPASLAPVFWNRISYSTADGELPFFRVPDKSKDSHLIRGRVSLPADVEVTGNFSHIATTNEDTGVEATSQGWKGRVVVPIRRGMNIQAAVRGYTLEVDDRFVDIVEPVSPAGPTAGRTYQEFYPSVGEIDFTRLSARNRSPVEFIVDFNYKPFRRTSLTLGYDHEELDREYFEVEKTVTDRFRAQFNTRFGRRVKSRTTFESAWIDDPFAALHAAIPSVVQSTPSPGGVPFFGLQYFGMYDARQANLTAFPDRSNHFFQSVSWTPSSRFSLTGHYRYRGRSNDSLNFSNWERSIHMPGFEVWMAPDERWHISAGYNYLRDQSKTLYSVLAFDG